MIRLAVALLALLLASPVYAELQHVPRWTMRDGYACYTFDQARELLHVDNRLTLCVEHKDWYFQQVSVLEEAVGHLEDALSTQDAAIALLEQQVLRYDADLRKCIDDKHGEVVPTEPSWGWVVAGGTGLTVLGILLGYWIFK